MIVNSGRTERSEAGPDIKFPTPPKVVGFFHPPPSFRGVQNLRGGRHRQMKNALCGFYPPERFLPPPAVSSTPQSGFFQPPPSFRGPKKPQGGRQFDIQPSLDRGSLYRGSLYVGALYQAFSEMHVGQKPREIKPRLLRGFREKRGFSKSGVYFRIMPAKGIPRF